MNGQRGRIRIVFVFILFVVFLISGKLYLVQIVNAENYSEKADRQYISPNYEPFDRGAIYFSTKDGNIISAATLKSGFILFINPSLIQDSEFVYNKLSKILKINREDFILKASKKNDPYEEIMNHLDESDAEKIEKEKIEGVGVFKEKWRVYPGKNLSAQTLGFLGYIDKDFAGRYGLERFYNETLSRNSKNAYSNFFAEIFSTVKKTIDKEKELEGNIITTIEPSVEAKLEKTLEGISNKWQSKQVGGIIMNPKNGEIYAMAVFPSFDLNLSRKEKDISIFSNPLVESVYEMGSIIKPLTMASGIDFGAVTAKTTYEDKGFLELDKKRISNFDGKARGVVSMQEVLSQSLNTGVAFVAKKMGNENLAKYFKNFGFGNETGIDLPSEAHGLIDNLDSKLDVEFATASFGQGIALTPIETVRALSVLGNGGYLITPHLVKRIDYEIGISKEPFGQEEPKQVIKKETSEEITRMLVEVVDKALVGGAIKEERFSIAAKTGTAQIAKSDGGGYYKDRYLHSFFGYFPAFDPKFLIFLYHLEPKGVDYASQTLAYPFSDLVQFLIGYYEVPPDR